jgi:uncharacterized protein (TIGR01244 family)
MKRTLCILVGILWLSFAWAGEKPVKFPTTIDDKGFQGGIFDVGLGYVSGQPSEEALRRFAKDGVTTVVSVRGKNEMDDRSQVPFDEEALLKELKVEYYNIPIGSPPAVERFAQAVAKSKGKVLLHCTVAWRATYMWMAYLIKERKFSIDDAWKAGMQMSVTVDRASLMLDTDVSYRAVPHTENGRKPKEGVISKPGSKIVITSPKVIDAQSKDFRAFVMWDMGSILNASQPDEKKLRELAGQGVKTIVNLRSQAEMDTVKTEGFDEEDVAKELGMKYVQVPIGTWQTFTPAALAQVAQAFDQAEGRILFHCRSANRTSQVIIPYLVKYQAMTLDEARKVGGAMRGTENMLEQLLDVDIIATIKPKAAKGRAGCGG